MKTKTPTTGTFARYQLLGLFYPFFVASEPLPGNYSGKSGVLK